MSNETLEQLAREVSEERTPIELPATPLGEVAELLLSAQKDIGAIGMSSPSDIMALVHVANDKLAQARILVDVERGDGQ